MDTRKSLLMVALALMLAILVLCVIFVAFQLTSLGGKRTETSAAATSSSTRQTARSGGAASGDVGVVTSTASTSTKVAGVPEDAKFVRENTDDDATYSKIYTTGPTSTEFAMQLSKQYEQEVRDGATSATLDVYSPVTKQTYSMSCTARDDVVSCTGGNNARVILAK